MSQEDEPLVVDANVVVKWHVPERDSVLARRLFHGNRRLVAPDLLVPEVGNILWKKVRFGNLERDAAMDIAQTFQDDARVVLVPSVMLMHVALAQAISFGITMYDGLYVALAVVEGLALVTADERLANTLAGSPLARHIRLLSTI